MVRQRRERHLHRAETPFCISPKITCDFGGGRVVAGDRRAALTINPLRPGVLALKPLLTHMALNINAKAQRREVWSCFHPARFPLLHLPQNYLRFMGEAG